MLEMNVPTSRPASQHLAGTQWNIPKKRVVQTVYIRGRRR